MKFKTVTSFYSAIPLPESSANNSNARFKEGFRRHTGPVRQPLKGHSGLKCTNTERRPRHRGEKSKRPKQYLWQDCGLISR